MTYSNFITSSLVEASVIANNNFGKVSGITKGEDNNQVLTETDIEIGKFLISKIQQSYPDYNIIDEESGAIDNKSEFTWVIDPIDGTSNFANGVPTYGIMLGLLQKDIPIAGGIALPYFSEINIAEKGFGAFSNGKKITVTQEKNLLSVLVAYGIDGHRENPEITEKETKLMKDIILTIRNLRTSNCCFDTLLVAKGHYGACINQQSRIWDNVAQQIIIEEAGGVYTDLFGNAVGYTDPLAKLEKNYTWCFGAPTLHAELQKIIHRA